MSNSPSLVKNPYTKTVFKTDKELRYFLNGEINISVVHGSRQSQLL